MSKAGQEYSKMTKSLGSLLKQPLKVTQNLIDAVLFEARPTKENINVLKMQNCPGALDHLGYR